MMSKDRMKTLARKKNNQPTTWTTASHATVAVEDPATSKRAAITMTAHARSSSPAQSALAFLVSHQDSPRAI